MEKKPPQWLATVLVLLALGLFGSTPANAYLGYPEFREGRCTYDPTWDCMYSHFGLSETSPEEKETKPLAVEVHREVLEKFEPEELESLVFERIKGIDPYPVKGIVPLCEGEKVDKVPGQAGVCPPQP